MENPRNPSLQAIEVKLENIKKNVSELGSEQEDNQLKIENKIEALVKRLEELPKISQDTFLNNEDLNYYRILWGRIEETSKELDKIILKHREDVEKLSSLKQALDSARVSCGTALEVEDTAPSGDEVYKISSIPPSADIHVDITGEGRYPLAFNIGMNPRRGSSWSASDKYKRAPQFIYRKFSPQGPNHLPFADEAVDLVTIENGPWVFPGLPAEMLRIVKPGGHVIIYGAFEGFDEQITAVIKLAEESYGAQCELLKPRNEIAFELRIAKPKKK